MTPLLLAIGYGQEALARLFIEAGANINARSNANETLLIMSQWSVSSHSWLDPIYTSSRSDRVDFETFGNNLS